MSANIRGDGAGTVPDSTPQTDDWAGWKNWGIQIGSGVKYLLGVCKLIYYSDTKQLVFNGQPDTTVPLIHSDALDDTEYFVKFRAPASQVATLAVMSDVAAGIMLERTGSAPAINTPLGTFQVGGYDGTKYTNGVAGWIGFTAEAWSNTANGSYLIGVTQEPGTNRNTSNQTNRIYIRKGVEICDGSGNEPTGGDKGAGTLNVATGLYVNGSKGATYQAQPADPTGTTSLTGVMMGLAGAITPKTTGTVVIIISGVALNNTNGDGFKVQIRFGTGSAPANGAALTGSTAGAEQGVILPTANDGVIFSCNALLTGGSVGTTYWIDVDLLAVTGGTASIQRVSITAFELTV